MGKYLCQLLLLLGVSANVHAFNFEDFQTVIRDQKITNIPDAIAALPVEMRSNYDLMSDSMSAQPSSPKFPRAIMFGLDSKFVVTFNGDPNDLNYDRLEMMQFREETKEFEFRFVKFGPNGAEYSDKNPKSCLGCHGLNPRPIWGSYEEWTGTYGSGDRISQDFSPTEYENFKSYLEIQPTHERYRALIRDPLYAMYPFINQARKNPDPLHHSLRPGNRFGNLIARLTAQNMAETIRKSSYFKNHIATTVLGLLSLGADSWDHPQNECLQRNMGAFDLSLRKEFEATYPMSDYPHLYLALQKLIIPSEIRNFILQKLLLGYRFETWDINHFGSKPIGAGKPYQLGAVNMSGLVAARVLDHVVTIMPELKAYYQPTGVLQLFNEYYVKTAIAPHDQWYDSNGLFYDIELAQKSCDILFPQAQAEVR